MRTKVLASALIGVLALGCARATSEARYQSSLEENITFEVTNGVSSGISTQIYIIRGPCLLQDSPLGRKVEVFGTKRKTFMMRESDFGSARFSVHVRLWTPSGRDVVQEACTEEVASPLPYGYVQLGIPMSLRSPLFLEVSPPRRNK